MIGYYLSAIETDEERLEFAKFYMQHRNKLLYAAKAIVQNQALAEDALHDAFYALAKYWTKFSAIPCNERVPYSVRVVKNKAFDILRAAKGQHDEALTDEMLTDASALDISVQIESEDAYRTLLRCIAELPPSYQAIFEMRFIHEMGNAEIAKALNVSASNVGVRIHRARHMLQEILDREGIQYGK